MARDDEIIDMDLLKIEIILFDGVNAPQTLALCGKGREAGLSACYWALEKSSEFFREDSYNHCEVWINQIRPIDDVARNRKQLISLILRSIAASQWEM